MPESWLEADEVASDMGRFGWVSRDVFPDLAAAEEYARSQIVDPPPNALELVPVFMREQSEVEAKIAGYEWPMFVECTKRARTPLAYWRVSRAPSAPGDSA